MEKDTKVRIYSISLLVLIYLILTSIPFSLFIHNENVLYFLDMGLRLSFIPIYFIYTKKEKLESFKPLRFDKKDVLFIPFMLLTMSNMFVAFVSRFNLVKLDTIDMVKMLFFYILVALSEEALFRVVINTELIKHNSRIKTIVYSSLIFGLIHLVNISSFSSIPFVLLQVVYSFGLGLVLSLIYTYTSNFLYIFLVHFLFDFINGYLSVNMYEFSYNVWFFVINIAISIIFILYGIFIYKIKEKEVQNAS